jgi:hypothetical protein
MGEGPELGGCLRAISRDVNAGECSWGCPKDAARLKETSRRLPYKCESLTYGSNGRCGETGLWEPRSAPTHCPMRIGFDEPQWFKKS